MEDAEEPSQSDEDGDAGIEPRGGQLDGRVDLLRGPESPSRGSDLGSRDSVAELNWRVHVDVDQPVQSVEPD
jgi:hypothetical protein